MKKTKKGIEVSYSELIDVLFPSINYLGGLVFKDVKTMIKIAKIRRVMKNEIENFQDTSKVIVEKNALKKDGEFIVDNKQYKYENEDIKNETIKLIDELRKEKVLISCDIIESSELEGVEGVTPNSIESLGDFLKI